MCGLSTVVTPAGASLTMYREIRSYANSIWDDNNVMVQFVCPFSLTQAELGWEELLKEVRASSFGGTVLCESKLIAINRTW